MVLEIFITVFALAGILAMGIIISNGLHKVFDKYAVEEKK